MVILFIHCLLPQLRALRGRSSASPLNLLRPLYKMPFYKLVAVSVVTAGLVLYLFWHELLAMRVFFETELLLLEKLPPMLTLDSIEFDTSTVEGSGDFEAHSVVQFACLLDRPACFLRCRPVQRCFCCCFACFWLIALCR